MRSEDLLKAMEGVSEERLARSETHSSQRRVWLHRGGVAAACLSLFLVGTLAGLGLQGSGRKGFDSSMESFDNDQHKFSDELTESDSPGEMIVEMESLAGNAGMGLVNFQESNKEESISDSDKLEEGQGKDSLSDMRQETEKETVTDRKLIVTMKLSVEAEDYEGLISWIEEKTLALGGYIQNKEGYTRYNNRHYGRYVLRIPADSLTLFAEGITAVGNVTSSSQETKDVTLTYTDLQTHVKALRVEQERLMTLLEKADTLTELLEIEDRLTEIRYELESYQTRLLGYDNQIRYSTLYLDVEEVLTYTEPEPVTVGERIRRGFTTNWKDTVEFCTDCMVGILSGLPTILLCLVCFGFIWWAVRKILRKRKRKE